MTLSTIPVGTPRSDDSIAAVSVTELFTIGIGPSSSHTVGPMRAAKAFAVEMLDTGLIPDRVQAELFGSLSLTGRGHHSDRAVLLGLAGETPERVDPDAIDGLLANIHETRQLMLDGRHPLPFDVEQDLLFRPGFLPAHPNGMVFTAFLPDGSSVVRRFYSIGGGAIGLLLGMGAILVVTISQKWSPVFDTALTPVAMLVGLVVGASGGGLAAIQAARLKPADNLRN